MCGIAGFYSEQNIFSNEDLVKMTQRLQHRGPDASGHFFDGYIGLGHRRLSIIDLSEAANQPMLSHDNNFVIAYNGETYNFREIREEILKQRTIKFQTSSDTEVILEDFALWGVSFVNKLNGMFAIAIFNKAEKKLYLFRDRIGIKPLYYFFDGHNFAFASEIKSLLTSPFIKKSVKINRSSINEFLYLGYIPEPHTIYDKIYKFPSASHAVVNSEGIFISSYWNIEEKIEGDLFSDETQAKNKLKTLLENSVKYRLISDVPFGTFLSGGVDSSLVTAIAQSVSSKPVNTFSIRFEDSKYNESAYAQKVADYLGTRHHEFKVTEKDAIALIPELIDVYDEPFSDSSAIPTMLVSKLARKYVTMTLSGDGGDELFMGYGAYNWARRMQNPFYRAFHKPIYFSLSMLGDRYRRAAHIFDYPGYSKIKSHIFSQEQYLFKCNEIFKLLHPDFRQEILLSEDLKSTSISASEAQALFDLKYYLKDDLLVKVDRASMKYSLETRVPLLDYRIVEFAFNLSEKLKIKGTTQKYLLKEVLYDYIPRQYFDRPKWGFAIPLKKWLKNELKYLIDEHLSESIIKKHNICNFRKVEELKDCFLNKGYDYIYNRLWLLIVLHRFFDRKISDN
ncbi:MAG: asparagine synthase (glutamine-hydrolyzing) [Bacteroidales bacterium]|nr:asparagine synthase (glutamine-hydrolyzing) [Bacteroidales bacterium]